LPRELDSLEALRELHLDGTSVEDIPVSKDMKHLKTLSACNCQSLAQVSSEIGDVNSLVFLSDGSELAALPDSIEGLERLKQLSMRDCLLMWKLPDTIRITSLENLDLSSTGIDELPHAIGDISNLTNLKELYLAYLEEKEAYSRTNPDVTAEPLSLSGIGRVTKVETLELCLTGFTTLPEEMGFLSQLRKLDL